MRHIQETLPFPQAIHQATAVMSSGDVVTGLSMPLHPGTLRFYREVNVAIPDHLIAE